MNVHAVHFYCLGGPRTDNSFESILYQVDIQPSFFGVEAILNEGRNIFKCGIFAGRGLRACSILRQSVIGITVPLCEEITRDNSDSSDSSLRVSRQRAPSKQK